MITSILKLSEIKKDPVCLLGWDRPAAITRYGDIVAYVVSPSRMDDLLRAESRANMHLDALRRVASGELSAEDLINLD